MKVLNDDDSANDELKRTMEVKFMGAVYCTREDYKSIMKAGRHTWRDHKYELDSWSMCKREMMCKTGKY